MHELAAVRGLALAPIATVLLLTQHRLLVAAGIALVLLARLALLGELDGLAHESLHLTPTLRGLSGKVGSAATERISQLHGSRIRRC